METKQKLTLVDVRNSLLDHPTNESECKLQANMVVEYLFQETGKKWKDCSFYIYNNKYLPRVRYKETYMVINIYTCSPPNFKCYVSDRGHFGAGNPDWMTQDSSTDPVKAFKETWKIIKADLKRLVKFVKDNQ